MLKPPLPPPVMKMSRFCGKCLASQTVDLCARSVMKANLQTPDGKGRDGGADRSYAGRDIVHDI
eukprot:5857-Eustigmatos_ZCMA.PRE.1